MTEMHATAEPAYLDRLALHSNPFSRQNLPGAFFAGRQTSQRLNLILHLLRSSSQICLLTAAAGYGKSMLLTTLQQRGGEDLRFCLLHASNNSNITQITQQCLQAFGATGDSQTGGDQQQLLRQRLQQLQQIQVTPVLLIDDAEQLDQSVQQQLAAWLHWQHEGQYLLRAVVSSSKPSAIENLRNERFQNLDLLPLADDEINGYLQQRLQAAGWQDDLPFTEKQLQRITRRSKGIPAEINHQAHQTLLGVNKSWQLPAFALPSWPMQRWIRWLPLLPVLAGLALLLFFQQNINDWLTQNRAPEHETVTEIPAEPVLPLVVVEDDSVTSNAEAEKENLIELLEELETEQQQQAQTGADDEIAELPNDTVEAPANVTEAETVIPPFTPLEEMPVAKEKTPVTEIATVTDEPTTISEPQKSQSSGVHDDDWIMAQKKSAYTFQLMGSWERHEIDEFIEKYNLNGDVAVFASMRENKVWYALLYGVYDSKSAAVNASEKWPAPLNGVSTWLRRFEGVQTQIREKAPDA